MSRPPRRGSIVFDSNESPLHQSERVKQAINHLIPPDQALYDFGHVAWIPGGHYHRDLDSDMIPLSTRFDDQAALGQFFTSRHRRRWGKDHTDGDDDEDTEDKFNQLTEQYSQGLVDFCQDTLAALELRDRYITLSAQRPLDNPLNSDDWVSYPPPQPKGWHYEDEYGAMDYYYDDKRYPHYYGENFDIGDYKRKILDVYMEREKPDTSLSVHCGPSRSLQVDGFISGLSLPNFQEFFEDLQKIIDLCTDTIGQSLSSRRLDYLRAKFESFALLNDNKESYVTKLNPHRDFYNVRKVDNNVDLAMSMTRKHLLNVINVKLKDEPDRIVYNEDGVKMTLAELFAPYTTDSKNGTRLNIDDLFEFGLIDRTFSESEKKIFGSSTRYDSIIKDEILLRIDKTFLRIDNAINGEYLSLILKQVLSDYEKSKYQYAELGINLNLMDICGRGKENKWSSVATWITENKLVSHNVKWVVRIPRNYGALRLAGKVKSFQEYLNLVFGPLFEVSVDPERDIELHFFLTKVSALSLLSGSHFHDERTLFDIKKLLPPEKWTSSDNPPYSYYLYYIFINLSNLNQFRKSRNLPTLTLRPFAASASDNEGLGLITESLASSFLLAKDIVNGEQLHTHSVLQYLYYLKQIGITMSPLCWNKTVQLMNDDDRFNTNVAYEGNPCIDFFKIGMRVSLSTNRPLFSSLTREPLIEEYSVAGSIHKLSSVDLCELCRNSVLISGYNSHLKKHWVGVKYVSNNEEDTEEDIDDFAVQRSNVPKMRVDYRADCVALELEFIRDVANGGMNVSK